MPRDNNVMSNLIRAARVVTLDLNDYIDTGCCIIDERVEDKRAFDIIRTHRVDVNALFHIIKFGGSREDYNVVMCNERRLSEEDFDFLKRRLHYE